VEGINKRIRTVQASPGKNKDPIRKITKEKGLGAWLNW
jgi:hypothetical protein